MRRTQQAMRLSAVGTICPAIEATRGLAHGSLCVSAVLGRPSGGLRGYGVDTGSRAKRSINSAKKPSASTCSMTRAFDSPLRSYTSHTVRPWACSPASSIALRACPAIRTAQASGDTRSRTDHGVAGRGDTQPWCAHRSTRACRTRRARAPSPVTGSHQCAPTCRDRLTGDVQPHHRERHTRLKDDMGRMRIGIDVELGRRRDVAQPDRTAHRHDLGHVVEDRRILDDSERNIRERPQRGKGYGPGRLRLASAPGNPRHASRQPGGWAPADRHRRSRSGRARLRPSRACVPWAAGSRHTQEARAAPPSPLPGAHWPRSSPRAHCRQPP